MLLKASLNQAVHTSGEIMNLKIGQITGMSPSMISKIRNGKRLADARLVYDKYKNDPHYMKNFYEN